MGGRVVGSTCLPASTLSSSPFLFFVFVFVVFVFGYRPLGTGIQKWITHSRTYTYYHQRRGIFEMKCVGEVVLTLFVLRI